MQQDDRKRLIAERLREARQLSGLSQAHVAKKMEWHRPTVSQIESGDRNVSADEVARLAEMYEVGVDWLTGSRSPEVTDPKLLLAARELGKLNPEDLTKLLGVLSAIRREGDE